MEYKYAVFAFVCSAILFPITDQFAPRGRHWSSMLEQKTDSNKLYNNYKEINRNCAKRRINCDEYLFWEIMHECEFKKCVLDRKEAVILFFYAPWSESSGEMAPRLRSVVQSHEDFVHVKVDFNEFPKIAAKYDVTALPTVFIFKNGQIIDKFVGIKNMSTLNEFIKSVLKKI